MAPIFVNINTSILLVLFNAQPKFKYLRTDYVIWPWTICQASEVWGTRYTYAILTSNFPALKDPAL